MSMNPFYDESILKKAIFPRWHYLWMWVFPTYTTMGEEEVIFYKNIRGKIYIVDTKEAPWRHNRNE